MGLFQLDKSKVAEASNYQKAIQDLKPEGFYLVNLSQVRTRIEDGKKPQISLGLSIIERYDADGVVVIKDDGVPQYKGAMLWYNIFITERALFRLVQVMQAYEEVVDEDELIEELNSFSTEAKLVRWVKEWTDSTSKLIRVGQYRDSKRNFVTQTVDFRPAIEK